MSNHTPGPWKWDASYSVLSAPGHEEPVIDCAPYEGMWFKDIDGHDAEANQRLVAAAPELYEALRDLLRADAGKAHVAACDKARAALAKVDK
jgi:hypothetical protein